MKYFQKFGVRFWKNSKIIVYYIFLSAFLFFFFYNPVEATVKAVFRTGKTVRGELIRVKNNTLYLRRGGFDLRLSLENFQALYFEDISSEINFSGVSEVILRNGSRIPIRRLIRVTGKTVEVKKSDGNKQKYHFEDLSVVFFNNEVSKYRVIYQNTEGETQVISYRPGKRGQFKSNGDTWLALRDRNYMFCGKKRFSEDDADTTGTVKMWSLPPRPDNYWSVRGKGWTGKGKWLKNKTTKKGSIKFNFHLNRRNKTLEIEGEMLTGSLLPKKFKLISGEKIKDWKLIQSPEGLTLEPCFLPVFLD